MKIVSPNQYKKYIQNEISKEFVNWITTTDIYYDKCLENMKKINSNIFRFDWDFSSDKESRYILFVYYYDGNGEEYII